MTEREQRAFDMLTTTAAYLLTSAELVKESKEPDMMLRLAFNAGVCSLISAWEYLVNGGDLPEWYRKASGQD